MLQISPSSIFAEVLETRLKLIRSFVQAVQMKYFDITSQWTKTAWIKSSYKRSFDVQNFENFKSGCVSTDMDLKYFEMNVIYVLVILTCRYPLFLVMSLLWADFPDFFRIIHSISKSLVSTIIFCSNVNYCKIFEFKLGLNYFV